MKQAMFAYVNPLQIRSWNQPVRSNEGKVSCSRKQQEPLLGLKLTTDRHPATTSQTPYPLRHTALQYYSVGKGVWIISYLTHRIDLSGIYKSHLTTKTNSVNKDHL